MALKICAFAVGHGLKKGFCVLQEGAMLPREGEDRNVWGIKRILPLSSLQPPRDQHLLMVPRKKKIHGLMNNKWAENSSSWQGKRNILLDCQVWAAAHWSAALAWARQELSTALLTMESRNLGMKWERKVSQNTDNEVNPHWTKNCFPGWDIFVVALWWDVLIIYF